MRGNIDRSAGSRCDVRGLDFQARQCPPNWSIQALGFSGTLAASTTTIIEQEPQVVFLPTRLYVPSSVAGADVAIADIKVGNQTQLPADGDLPVSMFSEVSQDACIWFDSADAGVKISITFRNKTVAAIDIESAMKGYASPNTRRFPA